MNLGRYQDLPLALPRNLVPESQLKPAAASHIAAAVEKVGQEPPSD